MRQMVILETALLLSAVFVHILLAPFTKVEESFNIQATHDLLYMPWGLVTSFDHIEFPGVVPRTFIGPIFLSALAYIPKKVLRLDSLSTLHLVRLLLGILSVASLVSIRISLSRRFTSLTGTLFTLITLSQFHILFYASRTLPNTFALILTNFALADRIRPRPYMQPYRAISLISVACALFRSELCTYIFFTLLVDVTRGDLALPKTCAVGLSSAVVSGLSSALVDSYFWNKLSYPELEVFYFNVVLNQSSAWGTHPVHWYFTNALPRALGGSYILAFIGVLQSFSLLHVFIPAFLFVCVYSALPHKELRFIFYALPAFNAIAAVTMEKAFRELRAGRFDSSPKKHDASASNAVSKRPRRELLQCYVMTSLALATLIAAFSQTGISTAASYWNYPSGYAMREMHTIENRRYISNRFCDDKIVARVHIDADSAMNGISQFLETHADDEHRCPRWTYSKKEKLQQAELSTFTHLISSRPFVDGFCVFHVQKRFSGLNWRKASLRLEPHIYVHRSRGISTLGCSPHP